MIGESNSVPIACRPDALTPAQRDRSRALREELAASTQETRAGADGYEFRLRDDPDVFRKAAEWITLERRCCPFMAFDLRWAQGESSPVLGVTGPEGTKEFLAGEMPELPHE
jgi:hypothetical protein